MFKTLGPPLVALVALLALWEALTWALHVPAFLLPPPSGIAGAIGADFRELLLSACVTAMSSLGGFFLSAMVGTLVGIALGSSRLLERALYPYAVFLQTVPIVAIAPLLVLWCGAGLRAVILSAFIVSLFPVIASVVAGIQSVDPALRDLFRIYGASRFARLTKLELPAALPSGITGLRVAAGLAVIGSIVGEFVAGFSESNAGLGILIMTSYRQLHTDLLFAAVLFSSGIGLLLFTAVNAAGYFLLRRWHPSLRGQ